jgi:predicted DNA-binding protein with PD1-like motif
LNEGIKMVYVEFNPGRNFLVRVEHDSDLIQFVTELAEKEKIVIATITAVGALKQAKLGFYDQENHEYHEIRIDSPHEIACCVGNISIKDGRPFIHAHAVLADKNGNTKAGHLLKGTVFAAEVHLRELKGAELERKYDNVTGLSLWETK